MSKVYCQDCEKYTSARMPGKTGHYVGPPLVFAPEKCIVMVDDYFMPNHEAEMIPSKLNEKGDCQYFEMKKSGK